jgi:glycolate oxidase iron-sulfur subunit
MTVGYIGADRPELADLDRCTRCGLCEQACPTYRVLHFEPDSPRGRVHLMKQVAEGAAGVDENFAHHLYQCLGCRACETACPAGVPYGKLLERARYQIESHGEIDPIRRGWRSFRRLAFEKLLPNRWAFDTVLLPARVLQRMPRLLTALQSAPLPPRLSGLIRMIPRQQSAAQICRSERAQARAASDSPRLRVGLFLGCIMRSLFARVHQATVQVLAENGCEVIVPEDQWCCGALNVHAGERKLATEMARRNLRAFAGRQLDAIVVNSAGCGAHLKEYPELLGGDAAAAEFSAKVRDVNELLAARELRPMRRPLSRRVTYQDACHLLHAQKIKREPRDLLKQIPGVQYVELRGSDECCGAAGVYSLTHPALARTILQKKLDDIEATRADVVATANPGCAMQLQAGLLGRGLPARVCHVVELLAEAYQGP